METVNNRLLYSRQAIQLSILHWMFQARIILGVMPWLLTWNSEWLIPDKARWDLWCEGVRLRLGRLNRIVRVYLGRPQLGSDLLNLQVKSNRKSQILQNSQYCRQRVAMLQLKLAKVEIKCSKLVNFLNEWLHLLNLFEMLRKIQFTRKGESRQNNRVRDKPRQLCWFSIKIH